MEGGITLIHTFMLIPPAIRQSIRVDVTFGANNFFAVRRQWILLLLLHLILIPVRLSCANCEVSVIEGSSPQVFLTLGKTHLSGLPHRSDLKLLMLMLRFLRLVVLLLLLLLEIDWDVLSLHKRLVLLIH